MCSAVVPSGPFQGWHHQCWGRPSQTGPHRTRVPTGAPGTRVHAHVSVTGNQFSKRPPASKSTSITIAVRDEGRQVGARPGLAETAAPGTAVTLCHCGQLSAPAASRHRTRHKTYPQSGWPAELGGGRGKNRLRDARPIAWHVTVVFNVCFSYGSGSAGFDHRMVLPVLRCEHVGMRVHLGQDAANSRGAGSSHSALSGPRSLTALP